MTTCELEKDQPPLPGVHPAGLHDCEVSRDSRRLADVAVSSHPAGHAIGGVAAGDGRGELQSGVLPGHFDIEQIAAWLCSKSGGDWAKPYTKRRVWMRRALALTALADQRLSKAASMGEARKIMEASA